MQSIINKGPAFGGQKFDNPGAETPKGRGGIPAPLPVQSGYSVMLTARPFISTAPFTFVLGSVERKSVTT